MISKRPSLLEIDKAALLDRVRFGNHEAVQQLIWHSLSTINTVVQKYRFMGVSDDELLTSSLDGAMDCILSYSQKTTNTTESFKQRVNKRVESKVHKLLTTFYVLDDKEVGFVVIYFEARKKFFDATEAEATDGDFDSILNIIRNYGVDVGLLAKPRKVIRQIHDIYFSDIQYPDSG